MMLLSLKTTGSREYLFPQVVWAGNKKTEKYYFSGMPGDSGYANIAP
jgi:hypothetical protein